MPRALIRSPVPPPGRQKPNNKNQPLNHTKTTKKIKQTQKNHLLPGQQQLAGLNTGTLEPRAELQTKFTLAVFKCAQVSDLVKRSRITEP